MDFLIKLKDIDRRWIFLFLAFSLILPMIFKPHMKIVASKAVQELYDYIEKLPEGTRCFLSFDFDPGAEPELGPTASAVLTHMLRRNLKPVMGGNWPLAGELAERGIATAIRRYQETYEESKSKGLLAPGAKYEVKNGEDYVILGYKTGGTIHVKNISKDFLTYYPQDKDGVSTANMKIFQNSDGRKFKMQDFGLVFSMTAGTNGIEAYISMASEHKCTMSAACTSVNIPKFTTYRQTKQLVGSVGGLPAAAEYESLVGYYGTASEGIGPQTMAHLLIMFFIVVGNMSYFAERWATKKSK
ncbi:MAG: hypothetical protein GX221_03610 [Candidatus Riflebacteria bacterium]|nr:hypothetical protein [Candidatus Riflebacteria bacterium]